MAPVVTIDELKEHLAREDAVKHTPEITLDAILRQFKRRQALEPDNAQLKLIEHEVDALTALIDAKEDDDPDDQSIRIDGEFVNIQQYLSSPDFKRHLVSCFLLSTTLHSTQATNGRSSTPLSKPSFIPESRRSPVFPPHRAQLESKERLKRVTQKYNGAFLADSCGAGKSLTSLMAALELQEEVRPEGGFILIVCYEDVVPQWGHQIMEHWE